MGDIIKRGTKDRPRFYVRYKDVDGVRRLKAAKVATMGEARTVLAAIETRIAKGHVGIIEPTKEDQIRATMTVKDLADRFLGDVNDVPGYASPKIKSLENYRRDARTVLTARILPAIGKRAAASVTVADVECLCDALRTREKNKLAAASVVQTMAVLSKLFAWGRKAGHVNCPNPVAGIERPRTTHSIDYLDAAEVARLLSACEQAAIVGVSSWQSLALGPMVATAIYCGLRKGELFGLRWRDVDLDAARIDVMRSYDLLPKSGEARHVPMHPELVRILRVWKRLCPATPEAVVFPVEADPTGGRSFKARPTTLRMGVKLDTMGLADLFAVANCHPPTDGKVWHMLRHTFASHAMMSGASLYGVQRLLGHATPKMTQRYAHLSPDHLAGEVARMSFAPRLPAGVADMGEERRRRASGEDGYAVDTSIHTTDRREGAQK